MHVQMKAGQLLKTHDIRLMLLSTPELRIAIKKSQGQVELSVNQQIHYPTITTA